MLIYLRDLVKHTNNLGIEVIKITTEKDGNVKVEAMDNDKNIVVKGKFNGEVPELEGVCGLGQLDWLNGFLNIYNQKDDSVDVKRELKKFSVVVKDAAGDTKLDNDGNPIYEQVEENVICELVFKRDSEKMKNPYRVVDKRMIPTQFNFVGADWDVEITPSAAAIDMLGKQASVGYETSFGVKTEGGDLYVVLGNPDLQASFLFAKDVKGEMTQPWTWDIGRVLNILKWSSNAECTMFFLDKGILQITLKTGLAEYNYILPAKSR